MLVGRNGATIGEIGIKARRDLEGIFQSRFHLFLDVRVRRYGLPGLLQSHSCSCDAYWFMGALPQSLRSPLMFSLQELTRR